MVVVRFLGEDWDSNEKIVVSIPDNKPVGTNDARIAQALELEGGLLGWCLYHTEGIPPAKCRYTIPVNKSQIPKTAGISNGTWLYVRRADLSQQHEDRAAWERELQRRKQLAELERLKLSDPEEYQRRYLILFPVPKRPGTACPKNHNLVRMVIPDIKRPGLLGMIYEERKCGKCSRVTPLPEELFFCEECVWELCVSCRDFMFMLQPEKDEGRARDALIKEYEGTFEIFAADRKTEYDRIYADEEEKRREYGENWVQNSRRREELVKAQEAARVEKYAREDAERQHRITEEEA